MNASNLYKKEVFELFATIFIPGSIAICPYIFIAIIYYPSITGAWRENQIAISGVFIVVSTTVGLILESFGGWIESHIWDTVVEKKHNEKHLKQWEQYLKLRMDIEPVGQKYLRTRVMSMKFDLGVGLAILIALVGLLWLRLLIKYMRWISLGRLFLLLVILFGYLLWDSYKCAELLSRVRGSILESFNNVNSVEND